MSDKRDQWGSSFGFILAAVGSAVGLGNLWKFPYIAWDNNGGAFVLIYLGCILAIGMPVMMAEILIGRRAQASPVPAFEALAHGEKGKKLWPLIGWLGVLAGITILSFYAVIAGWSISSFIQCVKWSTGGYTGATDFGAFLANGKLQFGLSLTFSTITALIVMKGISGGIEKATRILMPVLVAIMVILVLQSFFLDGFGKALSFLFSPDFSQVSTHSVLEALGHAFFTLSLGMGTMITYGSYMSHTQSVKKASIAIVIMDTVIAMMACIIMYSIIFSFPEIEEQLGRSSVGMLFVTLPEMFYTKMTGGAILGPVFYILVGFAALSSTISLLEVVVALLVDKLEMSRIKATTIAASCIYGLSILCFLSLGASAGMSNFSPFGDSETLNKIFFAGKRGFLNIFDHTASNWFLPLGGLFTTLFAGWYIKKEIVSEELEIDQDSPMFKVYLFLIRFVAPLAILWIIVQVLRGADFS